VTTDKSECAINCDVSSGLFSLTLGRRYEYGWTVAGLESCHASKIHKPNAQSIRVNQRVRARLSRLCDGDANCLKTRRFTPAMRGIAMNIKAALSWIALVALMTTARTATAEVTIVFTFFDVTTATGRGFDDPVLGAERRAALEAVGAEIGGRIGQTATIEIGVAPSETDGTGPIGVGAATFLDTTPGVRDGEVYRRIVLGEPDTDAGLDAGIVFDFGYDVSLSGTPAPGVACFRDVARHELTHVLGYGSFIKADGTGFNETAPDMYTRFDAMLETDSGDGEGLPVIDSDGNLLLDASTFAAAHGIGLVFDGTASRAANSGLPIKTFGSDPTHSAAMSDVMFPSPAVGTMRADWTDKDVAILKDLGYDIVDATTTPIDMTTTGDCGACGAAGTPALGALTLGLFAMRRTTRPRRRPR